MFNKNILSHINDLLSQLMVFVIIFDVGGVCVLCYEASAFLISCVRTNQQYFTVCRKAQA